MKMVFGDMARAVNAKTCTEQFIAFHRAFKNLLRNG